VTQRNLNDGSVEAFDVEGRPVVSVQYHPEAAPGPHEAATVFDHFLDRVVGGQAAP
jgi:carbamoyl-phosphate synthase small subunit